MCCKKLAAIGLAVCTALAAAFAGSSKAPWDKPADTWTPADTEALLTNSPWAFTTGAYMEDPYDARESQPIGPPNTNERLPGENKPSWDGGPGRNRKGQLVTVPVLIRWESALPVRLAEKRTALPESDSLQWYVIGISGLVPGGVYHAAEKKSAPASGAGFDAHDPEEVKEAFMLYSKILRHGAAEITPENVTFDESTGLVRICFSRKNALDPDAKEVLFLTHFGKLNVKAKFRLPAMKFQGKIEL